MLKGGKKAKAFGKGRVYNAAQLPALMDKVNTKRRNSRSGRTICFFYPALISWLVMSGGGTRTHSKAAGLEGTF